MAQLYSSQANVVDALLKVYRNPELTMQHHNYISGEMGTGKTYMASALVAELEPKHVLISCPSSMPKKWQKVYADFTGQAPIIYTTKTTKEELLAAPAVIVVQSNLYKLVKTLYGDSPQMDTMEREIKTEVSHGQLDDDITSNYEFEHYFDFAIFDEIHTYKPTTQVFRALAVLCNSNIYMLGLTGTLFKQNIADLHCLLTLTNPEFNGLMYSDDDLRDSGWFYPNIWCYISVPISLKDVEHDQIAVKSEEDIKQEIMPLHGIDMSEEQTAWYDLAQNNLKRLGISSKMIDQVTTYYLDLPQAKQPTVQRSNPDSFQNDKSRARFDFFVGMTLSPIDIEKTPKFKQLKQILQDSPDKTIVFVQDIKLGKVLCEHLEHSFAIPSGIDHTEVADYVNSRLNGDFNIAIATTKQISTGIDLNSAHQIVWYEVPSDVTAILQAQRRVLRLNSTDSSKVWFLYYNDTAQEQIIRDVSAASTNNAAAYNVRATDNLAKLTGILFGNIDNDENED